MASFQHKKQFGQHFLRNEKIASDIVDAFFAECKTSQILEIGPGEGVLTKYLLKHPDHELFISEIDKDIIPIIANKFNINSAHLIQGDFLQMDFDQHFNSEFSIIGNFPYNISTEIVFKIIKNRDRIPMMTGMFQKEVADRIAAKHGNKTYGITSILTQVFYNVDALMIVEANEFTPPPKVKSAVIRFRRRHDTVLGLDEKFFFQIVKAGFNQRRKTLRNSLKSIVLKPERLDEAILNKRAEQLSVDEWVNFSIQVKSQQ
jgi:16S rRNA (adenine1518-N6/adenine1519-N6)-dimethyltransferase